MVIVMEQTINLMGRINPLYTQELVEQAQQEGRVVTLFDEEGNPKSGYLRVETVDMNKFITNPST